MASEQGDPVERQRYVSMMAQAFEAMSVSLETGGLTGVVFAHTHPDAWATLIEGLLGSGLVPDASWPIDTELQNKISAGSRANLKTSVWMACRKRDGEAGEAFLSDVMEEMGPVIRERLLYFWGKGIRGADFFISAIGPALSVFGRHTRVLRPDGSGVSVRDFLDIVRRESTTVALEQVLHGTDLGVVDSITRQYVTWVWSYSRAPLDAGEAIALCLATGAAYDEMTRPHSIGSEVREKSKKVVKLRTIRERAMDDEELGNGPAARPTPLVDQLQHAAWLLGREPDGPARRISRYARRDPLDGAQDAGSGGRRVPPRRRRGPPHHPRPAGQQRHGSPAARSGGHTNRATSGGGGHAAWVRGR